MERLSRFVCSHALGVLVASLALTGLAVLQIVDVRSGAVRLEIDASGDRLLPDRDPAKRFYDEMRRLFGSDETVIVALASEDVLSPEGLARVARLTRRLEALEGVHRVLSLTNALTVRGRDGAVAVGPLIDALPDSPQAAAAVRERVLAHPIYAGSLVAPDARATALVVRFLGMDDRRYRETRLGERIAEAAAAERGEAEVWITGGPHIQAQSARILLAEGARTPALVLMVLAMVLALAFRTVRGVFVPLVTVAIAVVWTMGFVASVGHALNAITGLIPAVLTTLGLSYAVHVVSEFYDGIRPKPGSDPRPQVAQALGHVLLPIGVTGLTTAAGFASFLLSPLAAVREFGLFALVGVLLTMLASITLTPALLVVLGTPKRVSWHVAPQVQTRFDRIAARIARFDFEHRTAIFVGAAAILVVAVAGIVQIRVGTQHIAKFRPDHPVRQQFEAVNAALGGANPLYVVLTTSAPGGFHEPHTLREVEALQEWLRAQPEIGGATSLVDHLKLVSRAFHGDDPAAATIPDRRPLVSQLLLMVGGDVLDGFLDRPGYTTVVRVRSRVIDSDAVAALVTRIEGRLAELPSHLEATVTGTSVVFNAALDAIMVGQAASIAAALVIIFAILAGMFVSLRIGLVALIPNLLPVVAYFGALGWSGVRLSPGTSLIAPMVLGIAVDDTVHYFARFIQEARRRVDERAATAAALAGVGRPVSYTSLALCAGFLVLLTSEFPSNAEVGVLAAFALAFAGATDFVLTPALCARLRVVTLWDLLGVDLGRQPERTIPLFAGLSATRARLVALLSSLVDVPAGERLIRAGEPGEALYVVIDGRLRESMPGAGDALELGVRARGDCVGEAGLFEETRLTDVEVIEDARLLRLTREGMERIRRRYPRTGAILLRNVSAVVARRLAETAATRRPPPAGPDARPRR